MKRVVIESPLNGPSRTHVEVHKLYARDCMRDSLMRGEAPFASHLLYDQVGLLDDLIPEERELGIIAGFTWGEKAELVAVYTDRGISAGMKRGIELAQSRGIEVVYRQLYPL